MLASYSVRLMTFFCLLTEILHCTHHFSQLMLGGITMKLGIIMRVIMVMPQIVIIIILKVITIYQ